MAEVAPVAGSEAEDEAVPEDGDPPPTEAAAEVSEPTVDAEGAAASALDAEALLWIRSRVILPGATEAMWTAEHGDTVAEFLGVPSQRRLLAFVDPVLGLTVTPALPQEPVDELLYFLKPADATVTGCGGSAPNPRAISRASSHKRVLVISVSPDSEYTIVRKLTQPRHRTIT